ncbi:MAG: hypothetical protein AAGE52_11110 [Myxococcota bacterium]
MGPLFGVLVSAAFVLWFALSVVLVVETRQVSAPHFRSAGIAACATVVLYGIYAFGLQLVMPTDEIFMLAKDFLLIFTMTGHVVTALFVWLGVRGLKTAEGER